MTPLVKRSGKLQRRSGHILRRAGAPPTTPILVTTQITVTRNVPIPAAGIQLVIQGGQAPYTVVDAGLAPNLNIDNSGKVTGTSTTVGSDPASITITDFNGQVAGPFTLTVITQAAATPLSITTTDVDLTQNQVIASPGIQLVAAGGDGDYTWSNATSLPAGNPALAVSPSGLLTGKPTGSGTDTFSVTVTDGNGETVTDTITANIEPDTPPGTFDGYDNRRIGFCMNQATPAMVREVGGVIAAGTNRLNGGKIRKDINGTQMGGSANPTMGSDANNNLNAIRDVGAQCNALLGYTHREDQRTLNFQGSTQAGKVVWTGGIGSGINSQTGVPGHRMTLPNHGFCVGEMSVRGPGIAYIRKFTGSTTNGENVFRCAAPTGDNHGAGANFQGCGIQGPGIQAGTRITGPHNGNGYPIDKPCNATRSASASYTLGRYTGGEPGPWICTLPYYGYSQVGDTDMPMSGGVTPGKSGTYTLGGSGASADTKLPYKDPADAQKVANAVMIQGGNRIGIGELWNEVMWPMGSKPFTDHPLLCRIFAHQYVGIKLAAQTQNRFIQVMFAGTGQVNDAFNRSTVYGNARTWYDICINFFKNEDPDYFTDLLTANGLTKERAPKWPSDTLAMHPYGNGIMDAFNMGMNQCAYVFNTVGAEMGDYLPICAVEQGLTWNRAGTGTSLGGVPNLSAGVAYTRYRQWIDIFHGNIPWPYNTRLQGPGAGTWKANGTTTDATHMTVTDRRAAMRKCFICPMWFAIQEPPDAHGPLGIAYSGGVKKYILDTRDPLDAIAHC